VNSSNQQVSLPLLSQKKVSLYLKREDLLHPFISGNKYRKLKYNLIVAEQQGFKTLLSFGGAYSNHIAATAYAGKENGFQTIGIIRGEELEQKWKTNPTLKFAKEQGMHFKFVSREDYRLKSTTIFLDALAKEFGSFFHIPEGGTNEEAVRGCEEILTPADKHFDFICSCVGTGGTIAGLINSANENQKIIGFPALKGDFLKEDIRKFAKNENWKLTTDYAFGGYAKINEALVKFINDFKANTGIPLDPIYTGKMVFGITDMVQNDFFKPGTKILCIHTGGMQAITGMNQRLKSKDLPLLDI